MCRRLTLIKKEDAIQVDLLNKDTLKNIFTEHNPDIIIHCAAMTDVNLCEIKITEAHKQNVTATKNLVEFCKEKDSKLIFISTDAVFDGKKGNYIEEDEINPINIYGKTKAEAEKIVQTLDNHLILRTSVLYGAGGEKKIINNMMNKLNNNEIIEVVDDIRRSPTLIDDIANAINLTIEKDVKGTLHLTGDTQDSLFEITKKIASVLNKDLNLIKPCSITKFEKDIAPQPRDSTLNIGKAKLLGINMKNIEQGIEFLNT